MKHYTYTLIDNKPHIVAENPFDSITSPLSLSMFNDANHPIIWDGPEFEGRKPESEIEIGWQAYIRNDEHPNEEWIDCLNENDAKCSQELGGTIRKIARPKEVEQPVQQEEKTALFKEGEFVFHKELGTVEVVEVRADNFDDDVTLIVGDDDSLRVSVWQRDCSPIQQSTPIASEGEQSLHIVEDIIVDWLKSGNENATYLAHLILQSFAPNKEQEKRPNLKSYFSNLYDYHEEGSTAPMLFAYTQALDKYVSQLSSHEKPQATVQKELSEISDDDLIKIAEICFEEKDYQYRCTRVNNLTDVHESIISIQIELFLNHPQLMEWSVLGHIQFDTEEFDINFLRKEEDHWFDDVLDSLRIVQAYQYLQFRGYRLPVYYPTPNK